MPEHTTPIVESNSFIVLDKYVREWQAAESYQSEADLERELLKDLQNQGYEYVPVLLFIQLLFCHSVSYLGLEIIKIREYHVDISL